MLLKFFIKSNSAFEAKQAIDDSICLLKDKILKINHEEITEYWKIKGVFVVLFDIELKEKIQNAETLLSNYLYFFDSLADHWNIYGYPINDELLASTGDEDCHFIKNNCIMIHLIL